MLPFRVNRSRCPFPTTPSSQRHLSAQPLSRLPREPRSGLSQFGHPLACHPERSEGSAFSSFDLRLSTFNPVNLLDALDAASTITPLFATLTKNPRGGVYPVPRFGEKNVPA